MTGFYGNGYCDVGPDDTGNHSVAGTATSIPRPSTTQLTSCPQATLTDPFLDFTASRGNNLRSIGLTAGCKWCLCARRWKEALDHASQQTDQAGESVVPKVHLHATSEKALDVVNMADLKKYAAEPDVGNASNVAQSRKGGMGGAIKERTELANKEEMTGRE
jgi:uncharacterized protein (DUF2237 family)